MRKIISIEHVQGFDPYVISDTIGVYGSCDGVIIKTNDEVIAFGITNSTSCCETHGYLTSEDTLSDFLGAEIYKISMVDIDLSVVDLSRFDENYYFPGTMFINIETSNGLLQLVAYNSHNGHYSHDVFIFSKEITHKTEL